VNKNKIKLRKVGIFSQQLVHPVTELLQEWFVPHGIEITTLADGKKSETGLDLIVSFGGDGTVLDGNYIISERSVLERLHPLGTDYAVNEIVVRGATRLIAVELSINGKHIRRVRGDGVIVGTATGSTAYLLAAGSPIVIPELRCMIIAGLNEYDFRSRHLVVTGESKIRLVISEQTHEKEIYLSADGKEKVPLKIGDEVLIQESARQAKLVFMEKNYFFHNLSSRLSWFHSGEK